jgi:hypothetical protein
VSGTEVIARPMAVPVGGEVDALVRVAQNLAAAGIYRKTAPTPEAVFAILLAARDMGVSATGALAGGIHMVEGKPEVSANLQAQLLREYRGPEGQRYDFRILTPVGGRSVECHIEFRRKEPGEPWEVIGEEAFTMDDAKRARLDGKDNYKKYPKMMLLARCLSDGIASHCPETARGLRVYGESEVGGAEPAPPLDAESPVPDAQPVDAEIVPDERPARMVALARQLLDAKLLDADGLKAHLTAAGATDMASVGAAVASLTPDAAVHLEDALLNLLPSGEPVADPDDIPATSDPDDPTTDEAVVAMVTEAFDLDPSSDTAGSPA